MDITVDTSVLIAVVVQEPSREKAILVTRGHSLIAPSSVHWEMGNALSAMCKRNRISIDHASACVDAYRQIPLKFVDVDLKQALELVDKLRVYAYDAYLLVCAMQSRSPLLTLDAPLKAAAMTLGIRVLEV